MVLGNYYDEKKKKEMKWMKNFNQLKAMDEAMKLFWKKGYEETTNEDLLEATGLDPFNFSEIYGSKDELYLAAFSYHSF